MEQSINPEDFIKDTKNDLEKKIKDMIKDNQILSALEGGKRLQALFSQLAYEVCTQGKETPEEYQKALEASVVIELAYRASLLHDNIIDENSERWGKPVHFVKNGVANTLLMGHKMLVIGFNIALKHGDDWARLYVDSWDEVLNDGLDLISLNKNGFSKEMSSSDPDKFKAYKDKIKQKTAALFSSVCKAGALEADMTGDILKVFSDYGREIGLAYQLADDLVDLAKGKMKGNAFNLFLKRLEDIGTKINALKKKELKSKFEDNKDSIIEICIEEISDHIEKAEELGKSKIIPDSPYKELLVELPRYIVNDMLKEIKVAV